MSAFSTSGKRAMSPSEQLQRWALPGLNVKFLHTRTTSVTALMIGAVLAANVPAVSSVEAHKA